MNSFNGYAREPMDSIYNQKRLKFIVTGMCHFVTRIFRERTLGRKIFDISEEDVYLPRGLKAILEGHVGYFEGKSYVAAHNHYVGWENREVLLKRSFISGLLEVAEDSPHLDFLRECSLYIMSSSLLEDRNFPEAPQIAIEAIVEASLATNQHEALLQWKFR